MSKDHHSHKDGHPKKATAVVIIDVANVNYYVRTILDRVPTKSELPNFDVLRRKVAADMGIRHKHHKVRIKMYLFVIPRSKKARSYYERLQQRTGWEVFEKEKVLDDEVDPGMDHIVATALKKKSVDHVYFVSNDLRRIMVLVEDCLDAKVGCTIVCFPGMLEPKLSGQLHNRQDISMMDIQWIKGCVEI